MNTKTNKELWKLPTWPKKFSSIFWWQGHRACLFTFYRFTGHWKLSKGSIILHCSHAYRASLSEFIKLQKEDLKGCQESQERWLLKVINPAMQLQLLLGRMENELATCCRWCFSLDLRSRYRAEWIINLDLLRVIAVIILNLITCITHFGINSRAN